MNWKSTIVLSVLAAGAGLWLWKGDEWGPHIGLAFHTPAPAESKSRAVLKDEFKPEKITRIEITGDPPTALTLEKTDGDIGWKLPGNWPLRKQEVAELVALFSDLHTRFQAIPIAENEDLTRFGLGVASKPLVVKVTAGGTPYTLAFGEPKLAEGESPFTRSAYLRINDNMELLRLGPDAMPLLRRTPDTYRRRQLFPDSERVKIASSSPPSPFGPPSSGSSTAVILTDKVKEIEVTSTSPTNPKQTETYSLKRIAPFPQPVAADKGGEAVVQAQRIAEAWELAVPQRDRLDVEKLQKILTTIPDLWVEEFATDDSKAGLDKPERTITVTKADGSKLSLLIGAVSKTVEREETTTAPPPMPGFPPTPITKKIVDEYRFAKLADNPQVFVVRADKLADLFVKADSLRDPQLEKFAVDEVQEIFVVAPGRLPVTLVRKKGDAPGDAERWMIDPTPTKGALIPAEASVVNNLLSQLSTLQSTEIAPAGSQTTPGTTIRISVHAKKPENAFDKSARTIVYHFGPAKLGPWPAIASATSALVAVAVGANAEAGTIPASIVGWPRIASVDASILKAADPEGGFRDRTLTNFTGADKLILERDGKVVTFSKTGMIWKQTAPKEALVDPAQFEEFTTVLGHLKAERFAAENATPDELKKYGLDAPRAKWTVLAGGKDLLVLLIGKEAEGKAFAKLSTGNAVVVLSPEASTKALADYRGRRVWELDELKIESIEVDRGGKKFKFVRKGTGWEDPAAPKDTVDDAAVDALLTSINVMRVERWIGDKPEDIKKAGLEKPSGTITLMQKDGMKRVLLLGGSVDEPMARKLYAKQGDPTAEVFVVGELDAARLTRDRSAYIEKK